MLHSGKRLSVSAFVVSGLVLALTPWPEAVLAMGQSGRKTTDPPIQSKGRLGQDLFLAIDHRDTEKVRDLLRHGADPNSRNGLELVPLHVAAGSYQPEAVKELVSAGAKVNASSPYGSPLLFSAMSGNLEGVKWLLSKGATLDSDRIDGITVLMMAAQSGNAELVAELIRHKVDVNESSVPGATALAFAARTGHAQVAKVLLERGAKADAADEYGQTPLMLAAKAGHEEVVAVLLEHGAKVNLRDKQKRTAIMLASSYGDHPGIVRMLLAKGADPKAADANGDTAASISYTKGFDQNLAVLQPSGEMPKIDSRIRRSANEAVGASLRAIETSIEDFSRKSSCISCHHEGLARMALGSAKSKGFNLRAAMLMNQDGKVKGAVKALYPLNKAALKSPEAMKHLPLFEINDVTAVNSWLLTGMAMTRTAPNDASAKMASVLARQQAPEGFWSFSLPRVPMQSSLIGFTALSIRSLQAYAPREEKSETQARIEKAGKWLRDAKATTSDDLAFRLLGLKWAGAGVDDRKSAIDQLLAAQRQDGGWSQIPGARSDAYSTGQALYALRVGGALPVSHPAVEKGRIYLLRTQSSDGTWFVNKRALPVNNYFDASFPHGESQYASFNGTCWAMLGLLETLDRA